MSSQNLIFQTVKALGELNKCYLQSCNNNGSTILVLKCKLGGKATYISKLLSLNCLTSFHRCKLISILEFTTNAVSSINIMQWYDLRFLFLRKYNFFSNTYNFFNKILLIEENLVITFLLFLLLSCFYLLQCKLLFVEFFF